MRAALTVLCLLILAGMSWGTVRALSVRSLLDNAHLMADPWFVVTLVDACSGLLLFWVWLAYREGAASRAVAWLLAILCLGNFATAAYLLWRLWKLPVGCGPPELLLRKSATYDGP